MQVNSCVVLKRFCCSSLVLILSGEKGRGGEEREKGGEGEGGEGRGEFLCVHTSARMCIHHGTRLKFRGQVWGLVLSFHFRSHRLNSVC